MRGISDVVCCFHALQQLWSALYQSWQRYLPTYNAVWKEIKDIKEHDTQLRNHVVRLRKYVSDFVVEQIGEPEGHLAHKSSATTIHKSLHLGTGQTWSNLTCCSKKSKVELSND